MAQATVNLAKSQGLAPAVEGSSNSGEESIDFKSLEDELYDDEVTHILSKENGTNENSINSNDSLNTPEIDYMGPCGDPIVEKESDDKENEEKDENDNGSDSSSVRSKIDDGNGGKNRKKLCNKENGKGLMSVSDSEDESRVVNASKTSDGYEDISDSESDRDDNNDEEKKETQSMENSRVAQNNLYDPISDDSNLSNDAFSKNSLSRPSTMYEPVSDDDDDDEVDDDETQSSQNDGDNDNSKMKIDNVRSIEEKSTDSETKSGIEEVAVVNRNSDRETDAENEEKNDDEGESSLIVSEVYSLQDSSVENKEKIEDSKNEDEVEEEESNIDLSTHNATLNSEREIRKRKKLRLKENNEGASRRKSKHSVRKSLDEEVPGDVDAYAGIEIKEEPPDYDEYAPYNGMEYPEMEFNISGGQMEGEFEYLDGTSVNVATSANAATSANDTRNESNSSPQKDQAYEVLHEGNEIIYRCKQCSCKFNLFFKYEAHRKKVHSKKYSCKYCGEQFDRSQILAIHVRVKHVLDSFVKKKGVENSQGKIRKFSIAEKKRKHESGLYGSQIVDTGTMATEETEPTLEEMYSPHHKKKKPVHKYVDAEGNLVKKAQKRKKLSSTVFVNEKLMYKCSYCNALFEKQQKMACHVRNTHILEKNDRNCLVYPNLSKRKKKASKSYDHDEPEVRITTVAEEDLDYTLNEEGDIIVRKKQTDVPTDTEVPAMYIDTEQAQKLSDELAKEGKKKEPKMQGRKRTTRISAGYEQHDEEMAQLQESYNVQIDSKIFRCQHCPKWFFRRNDLDFHMQKHVLRNDFKNVGKNGEIQDVCDDGMNAETEEFRPVSFCKYCPSKFESFNKLKIHVMRHLGEVEVSDDISRKKFTCRLCDEGTNDSKTIKKHMKIHFEKEIENLDPHSLSDCKYCGLPFLSSEKLQDHEKAHTDFLAEKANQKRLKEKQKNGVKKTESRLLTSLANQNNIENVSTNSNHSKENKTKSAVEVKIQGSNIKVSKAESGKSAEDMPLSEDKAIPLSQILGEQVERAFESTGESTSSGKIQINDNGTKPSTGKEVMRSILPPDLKTKLNKMKEKNKKEEKEETKDDDKKKDQEKDLEKSEEDEEVKTNVKESLIQKLFEKIPFECGMCKSRFPNSQFLLHHMTLHMKGKYVFRVDQDGESETSVQLTNVPPTSKNAIPAYKSPQPTVRPVTSLSLTKTPPNLKPVSRSPSKPAILKHSQPKPAAPSPGTSLLRPLNPVYAYPTSVIPASNSATVASNSTLVVRKVASSPKNIIFPRVISPSVANFGHTYAKPPSSFSSPSAPSPQAPLHLPYNASTPLILAPAGQPIYLMPTSVQQETKGVSLLSTSRMGHPTSSAPIFYAPINNQGMAPAPVQNPGIGLAPVHNQGMASAMAGKPLISIINPSLQSGANLQGTSILKNPTKSKTSVQRVTNSKSDAALKTDSVMRSLIKKVPMEQGVKEADNLPSIDSDEDLMNCSSPDSVMDMNSDSEAEDTCQSMNNSSVKTNKDENSSALENQNEVTNGNHDDESSKNVKIGARQLVHKMKKKYISKAFSRKDKVVLKKVKYNVSKFRMKKKIDFAKGLWYECPLCMFQYGKLEDYQKHLKTHRGVKKNKLHTCSTCGRQFMTKFHLEKHKALHRKNEYQCSKCDMSFDSATDVMDHMAVDHPG